ncbi:hypothetical protein AQUCO_01300856v1 [Aquilegia coerulea]|uniref:Major facilitator superfamily (MFS) profile domain-containing protein n=1 Tax=Aquilegia coerulea TaxID=218851 RepID=A0A2G5E3R4_AQUCA|nr:hypothetical protein AQUCO_01300856v1 [Aquilegia coerulea]
MATENSSDDVQDSSAAAGPPSGHIVIQTEKELPVVTPDIHNVSVKIKRANDFYNDFAGIEEQPSNGEIILWHIYSLCSYFVHTVLVPIIFPLIVSQIVTDITLTPPEEGCSTKAWELYQRLIHRSITVNSYSFTPLEWTAISWATGIFLATPILGFISRPLDHGRSHNLIFGGATVIGALFCLPSGAFKVKWIFPPYIAAIVAASMVSNASHTRHFGVMVRGLARPTTYESHRQFPQRRSVGSWLSLHATAVGCLGGGIISAFTYRMLHHKEKFLSLWVVSIFSGLKWIVGSAHAFSVNRGGSPRMLYVLGQLCVKPVFMLFLWLTYFIFPLFSLPLLHPLQQFVKTDALRMQLLGFFISATTSGLGFYYRHANWRHPHILTMVAVQSTATGILHAFGRVLLLDCTPPGKEGAFSVWFAWARAVGACGGFAVASVFPGAVNKSFAFTFATSLAGVLALIFGNISNYGGAVAAGHVMQDSSEKGSPVRGLDRDSDQYGSVVLDTKV